MGANCFLSLSNHPPPTPAPTPPTLPERGSCLLRLRRLSMVVLAFLAEGEQAALGEAPAVERVARLEHGAAGDLALGLVMGLRAFQRVRLDVGLEAPPADERAARLHAVHLETDLIATVALLAFSAIAVDLSSSTPRVRFRGASEFW